MSENNLKVIAIDDFQNKVITEKIISLFINGREAEMVSNDGRQNFSGLDKGVHHLNIESDIFSRQDLELDLTEEAEDGQGIIYIRLQPTIRYPLTSDIQVLWGQTEPGQELHFVFINYKERYSLANDYIVGENKICINYNGDAFFEGTLWILQKSDGGIEEFWIEKAAGNNTYLLRYPLGSSYGIGKCLLRRVYPIVADESGHFFLPVPKEEKNSTEYRYYKPLDKMAIKAGTFT
ncbi:MAG: hypothetical protein FWE14_08470 [Lachnospiraceae bacterium]|nr:hypothetical protein [Lachnospiraceae bacterium]